jgi:hypothetical protein
MAFLSLTLKDCLNRLANITMGCFLTTYTSLDLGDTLSRGWLILSLIAGLKTAVAALIVWYT